MKQRGKSQIRNVRLIHCKPIIPSTPPEKNKTKTKQHKTNKQTQKGDHRICFQGGTEMKYLS